MIPVSRVISSPGGSSSYRPSLSVCRQHERKQLSAIFQHGTELGILGDRGSSAQS